MSHHHWDYAALMRGRGFRVTPQRQLILDAICDGRGHTTLDEIVERVHAKAPAINRATVYRTLDFLHRLGLVVVADIGGRTVYEIAGAEPHHHLVCLDCGATEDLEHNLVKALFQRIEREHRFSVKTNHLALFGLCRHCRDDSASSRRARSQSSSG